MKRLGEISGVDKFNEHFKTCPICSAQLKDRYVPCQGAVQIIQSIIGFKQQGGFSIDHTIDPKLEKKRHEA